MVKHAQKAVGYCRVSSRGQVDGDGYERQALAIANYTQQAGLELVSTYHDTVSGTKGEAERPEFNRMLIDLLSNGCRVVVVERLDRLAREYAVQEALLTYLASKGIALHVAMTGENVTEAMQADPMRKALVQVQGVFAELEKALLVKKLRQARERKKDAHGKCEGRKGYDETSEGTTILRRIKALRRKKPGCLKPTWQQVADALNAEGLTTLTGKPWTATTAQVTYHRHTGS